MDHDLRKIFKRKQVAVGNDDHGHPAGVEAMDGLDRSVGIALKRKYQRAVLRTAGAELLIRLKAHIADIHHIIPVLPQQILGVGDKHGGDLIPYDQGPAAAADHFRRTPDQSLVDQLEPPRRASSTSVMGWAASRLSTPWISSSEV